MHLKKTNQKLNDDINLLRVKVDILLDMVIILPVILPVILPYMFTLMFWTFVTISLYLSFIIYMYDSAVSSWNVKQAVRLLQSFWKKKCTCEAYFLFLHCTCVFVILKIWGQFLGTRAFSVCRMHIIFLCLGLLMVLERKCGSVCNAVSVENLTSFWAGLSGRGLHFHLVDYVTLAHSLLTKLVCTV